MTAANCKGDDDWTDLPTPERKTLADEDSANGGIRREPELPHQEEITLPESNVMSTPEALLTDEPDDEEVIKARLLRGQVRSLARQAVMDPDDGIAL
jgi:type IV secretion system protein VirD4